MPRTRIALSALAFAVLLVVPVSRAHAQLGPPGPTGGNSAGVVRQEPGAPALVDAPRAQPRVGIAISRGHLTAVRRPHSLMALWRRATGVRR